MAAELRSQKSPVGHDQPLFKGGSRFGQPLACVDGMSSDIWDDHGINAFPSAFQTRLLIDPAVKT